jgi:hypothetical protein
MVFERFGKVHSVGSVGWGNAFFDLQEKGIVSSLPISKAS